MRVLLLTPPMTQLNTPYPATAYLTGFLRKHAGALGVEVTQADPALGLFLRVFSRSALEHVLELLTERAQALGTGKRTGKGKSKSAAPEPPPAIAHFLAHGPRYVETVDSVV